MINFLEFGKILRTWESGPVIKILDFYKIKKTRNLGLRSKYSILTKFSEQVKCLYLFIFHLYGVYVFIPSHLRGVKLPKYTCYSVEPIYNFEINQIMDIYSEIYRMQVNSIYALNGSFWRYL